MLPVLPADQRKIQLAAGDRLLIVSDGVTEACDQGGEEFGEARLLQMARDLRGCAASRLCGAVLDKVKDFSLGCPQADDLTVVAVNLH